jgi:hypothetical protein
MHACTIVLAFVGLIQAAPVHRRSEDVVSALTANALHPTAEGVDALGGQLSTIVGQVAGPDDSDSITAFLADTSIPATQEGVDILTGALDSRSSDNVVSALTANALNPTAEGVDALGGQTSTIVSQVAGPDDYDSITSFLADTSIPATQEGVDILIGAVSE